MAPVPLRFGTDGYYSHTMQTLIFNFKTMTVTVAGAPGAERSLADVLAAQRKIIANSPSTAAQQTSR